MIKYLTLFLNLFAVVVAGQHIDYEIELIDVEKAPVQTHTLEKLIPVANGAFLHHLDASERHKVEFFNQDSVLVLLESEVPVSLVGSTEEGVYLLRGDAEEPRMLLFLGVDGEEEMLTESPITFQYIRQLGASMIAIGEELGVRKYTHGEAPETLQEEYQVCLCPNWIFELDGFLVFPTRDSTVVTDGSPAGTVAVLSGRATPIMINNQLVFHREGGVLRSYDPSTRTTVNLSENHPNISGSFYVEGGYTVTQSAL